MSGGRIIHKNSISGTVFNPLPPAITIPIQQTQSSANTPLNYNISNIKPGQQWAYGYHVIKITSIEYGDINGEIIATAHNRFKIGEKVSYTKIHLEALIDLGELVKLYDPADYSVSEEDKRLWEITRNMCGEGNRDG
jgi:hypothetical protein